MRDAPLPHKDRVLNIWTPVGGAVWKSYRTFKTWNLARGSTSLEWALRVYKSLSLLPEFSLLSLLSVCVTGLIQLAFLTIRSSLPIRTFSLLEPKRTSP